MKLYEWNGKLWQFDEKDAPEGAVEVKQGKPKNKARTTARTKEEG
jgi:hypothetical protein